MNKMVLRSPLLLAAIVSVFLVQACATSGSPDTGSCENVQSCDLIFRRLLLAVADRIDFGWNDIVAVVPNESGQHRIDQYDRAFMGTDYPIPVLIGEYVDDLTVTSPTARFKVIRELDEIRSMVAERAKLGKKTFCIRVGTIGNVKVAHGFVAFSLCELRIDASGAVERFGDYASLDCLVYGNEKSGFRLVLLAMAVS